MLTISIVPSGRQPRPDGWPGTSTIVSVRAALVDRAHLMDVEVGEIESVVPPARALTEGKAVEQRFEFHGYFVILSEAKDPSLRSG